MSDGATPLGAETTVHERADDLDPTDCARELLAAVRTGDSPDPYLERLAQYDETALEPLRSDPALALAFWSNCYNAGTQLLLSRRPELYENQLRFFRFFGATALTVAGADLSLDAIEHGIVRGTRTKYGLGYLPRVLAGRFERRYSLSDPDPRVHFALNCGATSCPAIRVYDADRIDEQLDQATRAYLDATVDYDPDAGVVTVPKLFLWYRGDFGGGSGIRNLLREYGAIPGDASPRLRHRDWDWSLAPGKFAE